MGSKRDSGRGSFVESVMNAAETFYGDVLQKLRAWKPAPPQLKKSAERETAPEAVVAELVGVEPHDIAELPAAAVERTSLSETAGDTPVTDADDGDSSS
jgi:hypothetical protein